LYTSLIFLVTSPVKPVEKNFTIDLRIIQRFIGDRERSGKHDLKGEKHGRSSIPVTIKHPAASCRSIMKLN